KIKRDMMEQKIWAVAGVTNKKDRYGYEIWKKLKEHGYKAYGVNPNYNEIEDKKIYGSVEGVPEKIDVLNMVVGPKIGMSTLDEARSAGIENIWFQPGSHDDEIIEKAKELNFTIVYDNCIYAELMAKE